MNHRILQIPGILLALAPMICHSIETASATYSLTLTTDRTEAIYHLGETVTFDIHLQRKGEPVKKEIVQWKISKDGVAPLRRGEVTIEEGKATLKGTLDEPGFLHCEVTFAKDNQEFTAIAGAAIDPERIKPSLPPPDDFDAFWVQKKQELSALPLRCKRTPIEIPSGFSGVEIFDLQVDSIGVPARGYYGRPAGAKPKSCPALLIVAAAGVRGSNATAVAFWAEKGVISVDLNAHGTDNGKTDAFYHALDIGELKDYRIRGRESRETYYFLGMYRRMLRALDFLTAQPEWDGSILIIDGGSQGGAQSMAGAALDPRVSFLVSLIPAMCDHTGMLAGRVSGWPKLVPMVDEHPDARILETSRYFDSVNFASRVKAQTFCWVAFQDVICPPTTVYAAYNNLQSQKKIINDVSHGHHLDDEKVWKIVADEILAHIASQKKKQVSP